MSCCCDTTRSQMVLSVSSVHGGECNGWRQVFDPSAGVLAAGEGQGRKGQVGQDLGHTDINNLVRQLTLVSRPLAYPPFCIQSFTCALRHLPIPEIARCKRSTYTLPFHLPNPKEEQSNAGDTSFPLLCLFSSIL